MSRWQYRTQEVTDGQNRQQVRELTAGEIRRFRAETAKTKSDEEQADATISLVISLGAINPALSQEEADAMPQALRSACFNAIMGLSIREDDGEKKAPETGAASS